MQMAHAYSRGGRHWTLHSQFAPCRLCAHAGVGPASRRQPLSLPSRPHGALRNRTARASSSDAVAAVDTSDDDQPSTAGLTAQQVQSLLRTICEETELVEVHLGIGDYELSVRRHVGLSQSGADEPAAPPVNGAEPPMAIPPLSMTIEESLDEEATMSINESLLHIESPKVGVMRRGLYNKAGRKVGKGPEVGELVKKGATLCFIEQLGTFSPVVTPQQGELTAFEVEDGALVEYREAVVELAPYFGSNLIGEMGYD